MGCLSRGNGGLCSDFILGLGYLEIRPQRPNLNVHFGCTLGLYIKHKICQHCRPLPLDRHPTFLCLDDILLLGLEGSWSIFDLVDLGAFSSNRPKYLGKYSYDIPTHISLLYNWIYINFLKCIPHLTITSTPVDASHFFSLFFLLWNKEFLLVLCWCTFSSFMIKENVLCSD